jgi:hypothetical protein
MIRQVLFISAFSIAAVCMQVVRAADPEADRWKQLMSKPQYDRFVALVEADIKARKLTPTIKEGMLRVAEFADFEFGLDNVMQRCAGAAETDWPAVINEHMTRIIEMAKESASFKERVKTFEGAAPHLGLRIYPQKQDAKDFKNSLTRVDLEGTTTCVMVDAPTTIYDLQTEHARAWGKTDKEIFAAALKNLSTLTKPDVQTIHPAPGVAVVGIVGEDVFAASNVLRLASFPQAIGKQGAVVAIPNRHMVFAHPINDTSATPAIGIMMQMARDFEQRGPGSITANLYWYHDGGQFTRLPYDVKPDGQIAFQPPEAFRKVLNALPAPPAATRPAGT